MSAQYFLMDDSRKYWRAGVVFCIQVLLVISSTSALVSTSENLIRSSQSPTKLERNTVTTTTTTLTTNRNHDHISDIKYVDWAGCKGLLPIQSYKNCMQKESFKGWLRKPLPEEWNEDDDFDDIETTARGGGPHEGENQSEEREKVLFGASGSNKLYAENQARRKLDPNIHLAPIYIDSHIVCVNKASGVLSVPGPRRNPSVANLVHEYFGNEEDDVDSMVVHRLDMDTSGLIVYARSKYALSILHEDFRAKSQMAHEYEEQDTTTTVYKKYEALVCGHVRANEGEIDLPLGRDKLHPPFMKVVLSPDNDDNSNNTDDDSERIKELRKHRGYTKMMSKAPKESLTLFRKLSLEYLDGLPVTRLELIPITGRTHQLRVVMAAMGHPILGDNIYGIFGDGSPNGGLTEAQMLQYTSRACENLQRELFNLIQERRGMGDDYEGYKGTLCLHAKQLNIRHPITSAPMSFHVNAPF